MPRELSPGDQLRYLMETAQDRGSIPERVNSKTLDAQERAKSLGLTDGIIAQALESGLINFVESVACLGRLHAKSPQELSLELGGANIEPGTISNSYINAVQKMVRSGLLSTETSKAVRPLDYKSQKDRAVERLSQKGFTTEFILTCVKKGVINEKEARILNLKIQGKANKEIGKLVFPNYKGYDLNKYMSNIIFNLEKRIKNVIS